VNNLASYIERKLFTVNTEHAAATYYEYAREKKIIADALKIAEIRVIVHDCLTKTSELICKKHDVSKSEQKEYVEKIIKRIFNSYLKNVMKRIDRTSLRKLERNERFVSPTTALIENGDKHDALLEAIEVGFRFVNVSKDDESVKLKKILSSTDVKGVIQKMCGLNESDKLFSKMMKVMKKVQSTK
jgi:mannitol-1-phosphate 5-dehydrogenase